MPFCQSLLCFWDLVNLKTWKLELMLMRMFFCSFSFYKYWSSSSPPWPCDGGQRVRWSGFDRMIGVQPVDHTHPTFWSSHSHVISAYLYTDPIISPPGFHQQNLTWNKCSCLRMIAGPHIYPDAILRHLFIFKNSAYFIELWKLKYVYRSESWNLFIVMKRTGQCRFRDDLHF